MLRPLIRWSSRRGGQDRLTIFIFHRVLPEPDPLFPGEMDCRSFDRILGWIAKWFQVVPLHEGILGMQQGGLPPGAAAITFDDGYADNLHHAEPLLKRHGACATLFVATEFLDGGCMWNDRIIEAIRRSQRAELRLPDLLDGPLPLQGTAQRRAAIDKLIARCKYLQPHERDRAVERVVSAAAVAPPRDLMLTSDELKRWAGSGQQVGAHTVSHPILASLDDDAARAEMSQGRQALETLLDRRVGLFAYPNGKPGVDYLPKHADMARSLGFDAAVSTAWGAASRRSPAFELPRFTPWDRRELPFGGRLLHNLLVS